MFPTAEIIETFLWFILLAFEPARTRVDFVHLPIVYCFNAANQHASLAIALRRLVRLNDKALAAENVGNSAKTLRLAVEDLTELLNRKFLHTNTWEPLQQ